MLDALEKTVEPAGEDHSPATQPSKTKGIAILGSHPATVLQAPFADEGWAIWACSPHNVEMRTLPRVDAWHELHDPIEDPTRGFGYLKAVSAMPLVWMRDKRALESGHFKGGRPYPEEMVRSTFCPFMLTSSIAYIMAKAILDCEQQGIKQIGLWGIVQRAPNEYTYQRPGIQYFIWEATQRGIKVVAPRESALFDPPQEKW